ncbi:MAG: hypothetical protein RMJ98_21250 [Myxococcales bacterium]|nr:hypothetical protein [Polyangiaceae bacterium]MDW8251832.1 hypothetical protein [Myxococcales bacterium]
MRQYPFPCTLASLVMWLGVSISLFGVGCQVRSAYDVQRDNPLGPSFWIIPVPSDDDALLGRTFARPPDTSLTLEEQSAPNPCADKLATPKESPMVNHYENAINTSTSAKTGGLLTLYGFGAEVGKATHLLYKVDTSSKLTRLDTAEYQECCKQKGCGWGYVASLVKGAGEYAAGTEATAKASGNYSVVSGGVSRSYSVSNKRNIKGYIAAILIAHNREEAAQACAPGQVWARIECVSKEEIGEKEMNCRNGNPLAAVAFWEGDKEMQELFKMQQRMSCEWLMNHGIPTTSARLQHRLCVRMGQKYSGTYSLEPGSEAPGEEIRVLEHRGVALPR